MGNIVISTLYPDNSTSGASSTEFIDITSILHRYNILQFDSPSRCCVYDGMAPSIIYCCFCGAFLYLLKISIPLSFGYWMSYNVIYAFTLLQSVVLSLGNPKLKETFAQHFTVLFATKAINQNYITMKQNPSLIYIRDIDYPLFKLC